MNAAPDNKTHQDIVAPMPAATLLHHCSDMHSQLAVCIHAMDDTASDIAFHITQVLRGMAARLYGLEAHYNDVLEQEERQGGKS